MSRFSEFSMGSSLSKPEAYGDNKRGRYMAAVDKMEIEGDFEPVSVLISFLTIKKDLETRYSHIANDEQRITRLLSTT